MKKLYPIGTVVTLAGGTKPLMIYGRWQLRNNVQEVYDYVACFYPEGNVDDTYNVFFNHEDIKYIHFIGYQTKDEDEFQALVVKDLKKKQGIDI